MSARMTGRSAALMRASASATASRRAIGSGSGDGRAECAAPLAGQGIGALTMSRGSSM